MGRELRNFGSNISTHANLTLSEEEREERLAGGVLDLCVM